MTCRRALRQARLGIVEPRFRLVESFLSEERRAEDDLRVADLVDEVDTAVEQLQRVPRLLPRQLVLLQTEMDLRERRDSLRSVGVVPRLERDRKCLLQMTDRVLWLSEEIVETAEVVQHATEIDPVAVRLVELPRPLRERAGTQPM